MFTSHKQISPPSLVLKLNISEVSQKWIPKALELKRIPTHKKCKCKKFCSQTRLVGEIYSSDVIMHRGYSSMMYNFHKGSSGYSKKLPTETLITHKFIHQFVSCLLSHPSSFGTSSSSIYFLRKQHYMHPFRKIPVLCLNRLWRRTTSSVRFMKWWPFSVLNRSLLSSNMN